MFFFIWANKHNRQKSGELLSNVWLGVLMGGQRGVGDSERCSMVGLEGRVKWGGLMWEKGEVGIGVCVCVCLWGGGGGGGGQTLKYRPSHHEYTFPKQFLWIANLETSGLKKALRELNALWMLPVYPVFDAKFKWVRRKNGQAKNRIKMKTKWTNIHSTNFVWEHLRSLKSHSVMYFLKLISKHKVIKLLKNTWFSHENRSHFSDFYSFSADRYFSAFCSTHSTRRALVYFLRLALRPLIFQEHHLALYLHTDNWFMGKLI